MVDSTHFEVDTGTATTDDSNQTAATDRRGFQDVVPIQMLAGCTSGISSALIG